MKILWLSHFAPYPPKGGSLQRSFNMLKQLSREADITLLSLVSRSTVNAFFGDYNSGIKEIESNLNKYCKNVILIGHDKYGRKTTRVINATKTLFSKTPYDVVWLNSKIMKQDLASLLATENFDAVHVDTVGLWPYVSDLDLPVLLNHHNIESHMLDRRSKLAKWPLNLYLQRQANKLGKLERIACQNVQSNITCSSLDAKQLVNYGIQNAAVLPNGVDLTYFTRRNQYIASDEIKLIFAGGLEWYPNRDAVLFFSRNVWPLLREQSSSISMTIVGKGHIHELDEIAANDCSFKVTGFVPDVRPYLENASIYVCPIRDGGGTKLKVLDALAMGVPLVAHPIACEGIDVTEGKDVLFAETATEFAQTIISLSQDIELRNQLSVNGRKLIENIYSYEIIGQQIVDLYREVSDRH